MSKPVKVEFVAEIASYLRDTKKLEVSTEDIAEALVAVSNSSDDLERKLSRAMRDAAKDTEVLERAIEALPRATEEAADKADHDMHRMGDSAKDAGSEMGDSFRGSLGESLASGGADLSETLSETLGEAVAGAPLPVAALGGLILAAYGIMRAEAEKQKQELSELFDITDLITGAVDKTALMEEAIGDLGGGDLQTGLDKVKELAGTLGIPISDVTAMLTGETGPAIDAMVTSLQQSNRELNTNWITSGKISDEDRKILEAQQEILDQHKAQVEELGITAERTETWQQGLVGVQREVIDIGQSLKTVDANMDGTIDKADELALRAADTNFDGMVDSVEAAKAGLDEVYEAAAKMPDPGFDRAKADAAYIAATLNNLKPVHQVELRTYYTGPGRKFVDPTSPEYSPGHVAIANAASRP